MQPADWPRSPPPFNPWHENAAAFVRIVQDNPMLWCLDERLKHVTLTIDTRSGHFLLRDGDGREIEPERVLRAARKARERFGEQP